MNKPMMTMVAFAVAAALGMACLGCSASTAEKEDDGSLATSDTPAAEEPEGAAEDENAAETETAAEAEVAVENEGDTNPEAAKAANPTVEDSAAEPLPPYAGDTSTLDGNIANYLIAEFSPGYEAPDTWIPVVQTVAVDESNAEDIKCWGSYWILGYDQNGTTLECSCGGNYPGCVHLAKTAEGGYEVTSMDVAEDGERWYGSLVEICGGDSALADEIAAATDLSAEPQAGIRTDAIRAYVQENGLNVTAYQDFGWDPVEL
jgi:beta-glucosidase-like glycosyl hydrolase